MSACPSVCVCASTLNVICFVQVRAAFIGWLAHKQLCQRRPISILGAREKERGGEGHWPIASQMGQTLSNGGDGRQGGEIRKVGWSGHRVQSLGAPGEGRNKVPNNPLLSYIIWLPSNRQARGEYQANAILISKCTQYAEEDGHKSVKD